MRFECCFFFCIVCMLRSISSFILSWKLPWPQSTGQGAPLTLKSMLRADGKHWNRWRIWRPKSEDVGLAHWLWPSLVSISINFGHLWSTWVPECHLSSGSLWKSNPFLMEVDLVTWLGHWGWLEAHTLSSAAVRGRFWSLGNGGCRVEQLLSPWSNRRCRFYFGLFIVDNSLQQMSLVMYTRAQRNRKPWPFCIQIFRASLFWTLGSFSVCVHLGISSKLLFADCIDLVPQLLSSPLRIWDLNRSLFCETQRQLLTTAGPGWPARLLVTLRSKEAMSFALAHALLHSEFKISVIA